MGTKIFGIDVQAEIASAITPNDLPNFLLRKKVVGTRTSNNLSGGTNNTTPVDYKCHGALSEFTYEEKLEAPLIEVGDQKATIIAKPLADAGVEPEIDDFLVDGAKIYTIIMVKSNSAKAAWICVCRG